MWFGFYDGYDHSNISSHLKANYYMTLKYFHWKRFVIRISWRGLLYSLLANNKSVVLTSGLKNSVDNISMNELESLTALYYGKMNKIN